MDEKDRELIEKLNNNIELLEKSVTDLKKQIRISKYTKVQGSYQGTNINSKSS